MKYNTLVYLFFFYVLILGSCVNIKIINTTSCNINRQQLKQELLKQNVRSFEGVIWYGSKAEAQDSSLCIGSYKLAVNKWKGFKNSTNLVTIPVLASEHSVFINTYFIGGELNNSFERSKIDEMLHNSFQIFKNDIKEDFTDKKLDSIKSIFFRGVQIQTKGNLRH